MCVGKGIYASSSVLLDRIPAVVALYRNRLRKIGFKTESSSVFNVIIQNSPGETTAEVS